MKTELSPHQNTKFVKSTLNQIRDTLDDALKKHGWIYHYVFETEEAPNDKYPFGYNIHTHGIKESFNHLDIQICFSIIIRTCRDFVARYCRTN